MQSGIDVGKLLTEKKKRESKQKRKQEKEKRQAQKEEKKAKKGAEKEVWHTEAASVKIQQKQI